MIATATPITDYDAFEFLRVQYGKESSFGQEGSSNKGGSGSAFGQTSELKPDSPTPSSPEPSKNDTGTGVFDRMEEEHNNTTQNEQTEQTNANVQNKPQKQTLTINGKTYEYEYNDKTGEYECWFQINGKAICRKYSEDKEAVIRAEQSGQEFDPATSPGGRVGTSEEYSAWEKQRANSGSPASVNIPSGFTQETFSRLPAFAQEAIAKGTVGNGKYSIHSTLYPNVYRDAKRVVKEEPNTFEWRREANALVRSIAQSSNPKSGAYESSFFQGLLIPYTTDDSLGVSKLYGTFRPAWALSDNEYANLVSSSIAVQNALLDYANEKSKVGVQERGGSYQTSLHQKINQLEDAVYAAIEKERSGEKSPVDELLSPVNDAILSGSVEASSSSTSIPSVITEPSVSQPAISTPSQEPSTAVRDMDGIKATLQQTGLKKDPSVGYIKQKPISQKTYQSQIKEFGLTPEHGSYTEQDLLKAVWVAGNLHESTAQKLQALAQAKRERNVADAKSILHDIYKTRDNIFARGYVKHGDGDLLNVVWGIDMERYGVRGANAAELAYARDIAQMSPDELESLAATELGEADKVRGLFESGAFPNPWEDSWTPASSVDESSNEPIDALLRDGEAINWIDTLKTSYPTTLKPSEISVYPKDYQYKTNTDAKTGANQAWLDDKKEFLPGLSETIDVWQDPDTGEYVCINGHHRLALAKARNWEGDLNVRCHDVRTKEEARVLGALLNIQQRKGTAIDGATILREMNLPKEVQDALGFGEEDSLGGQAQGIANLEDGLYRDVIKGRLTPRVGGIIGATISMGSCENAAEKQRACRDYMIRKGYNDNTSYDTLRAAALTFRNAQFTEDSSQPTFFSMLSADAYVDASAALQVAVKKKLSDERGIARAASWRGSAMQDRSYVTGTDEERAKAMVKDAKNALRFFDHSLTYRKDFHDQYFSEQVKKYLDAQTGTGESSAQETERKRNAIVDETVDNLLEWGRDDKSFNEWLAARGAQYMGQETGTESSGEQRGDSESTSDQGGTEAVSGGGIQPSTGDGLLPESDRADNGNQLPESGESGDSIQPVTDASEQPDEEAFQSIAAEPESTDARQRISDKIWKSMTGRDDHLGDGTLTIFYGDGDQNGQELRINTKGNLANILQIIDDNGEFTYAEDNIMGNSQDHSASLFLKATDGAATSFSTPDKVYDAYIKDFNLEDGEETEPSLTVDEATEQIAEPLKDAIEESGLSDADSFDNLRQDEPTTNNSVTESTTDNEEDKEAVEIVPGVLWNPKTLSIELSPKHKAYADLITNEWADKVLKQTHFIMPLSRIYLGATEEEERKGRLLDKFWNSLWEDSGYKKLVAALYYDACKKGDRVKREQLEAAVQKAYEYDPTQLPGFTASWLPLSERSVAGEMNAVSDGITNENNASVEQPKEENEVVEEQPTPPPENAVLETSKTDEGQFDELRQEGTATAAQNVNNEAVDTHENETEAGQEEPVAEESATGEGQGVFRTEQLFPWEKGSPEYKEWEERKNKALEQGVELLSPYNIVVEDGRTKSNGIPHFYNPESTRARHKKILDTTKIKTTGNGKERDDFLKWVFWGDNTYGQEFGADLRFALYALQGLYDDGKYNKAKALRSWLDQVGRVYETKPTKDAFLEGAVDDDDYYRREDLISDRTLERAKEAFSLTDKNGEPYGETLIKDILDATVTSSHEAYEYIAKRLGTDGILDRAVGEWATALDVKLRLEGSTDIKYVKDDSEKGKTEKSQDYSSKISSLRRIIASRLLGKFPLTSRYAKIAERLLKENPVQQVDGREQPVHATETDNPDSDNKPFTDSKEDVLPTSQSTETVKNDEQSAQELANEPIASSSTTEASPINELDGEANHELTGLKEESVSQPLPEEREQSEQIEQPTSPAQENSVSNVVAQPEETTDEQSLQEVLKSDEQPTEEPSQQVAEPEHIDEVNVESPQENNLNEDVEPAQRTDEQDAVELASQGRSDIPQIQQDENEETRQPTHSGGYIDQKTGKYVYPDDYTPEQRARIDEMIAESLRKDKERKSSQTTVKDYFADMIKRNFTTSTDIRNLFETADESWGAFNKISRLKDADFEEAFARAEEDLYENAEDSWIDFISSDLYPLYEAGADIDYIREQAHEAIEEAMKQPRRSRISKRMLGVLKEVIDSELDQWEANEEGPYPVGVYKSVSLSDVDPMELIRREIDEKYDARNDKHRAQKINSYATRLMKILNPKTYYDSVEQRKEKADSILREIQNLSDNMSWERRMKEEGENGVQLPQLPWEHLEAGNTEEWDVATDALYKTIENMLGDTLDYTFLDEKWEEENPKRSLSWYLSSERDQRDFLKWQHGKRRRKTILAGQNPDDVPWREVTEEPSIEEEPKRYDFEWQPLLKEWRESKLNSQPPQAKNSVLPTTTQDSSPSNVNESDDGHESSSILDEDSSEDLREKDGGFDLQNATSWIGSNADLSTQKGRAQLLEDAKKRKQELLGIWNNDKEPSADDESQLQNLASEEVQEPETPESNENKLVTNTNLNEDEASQTPESSALDEYDLSFIDSDEDINTSFEIDDGKYSDEKAERAVENVIELDDRVKEALKKGAELLVQEQTDTLTQAKETLEAAIHANPHAGAEMDALADEVVKSYTELLKVHPLRIPNEVLRFIIDTASELCSKYKNGFLGKVIQKMGFHEESGHDNDKTFRRIIESLASDRNRSGIMWQLEGGGTDGIEYKNLLAGYAAIKQGFGARNSAAVRKCLEWAGIYDPAFSDIEKAGSTADLSTQEGRSQLLEDAKKRKQELLDAWNKDKESVDDDESQLQELGTDKTVSSTEPENGMLNSSANTKTDEAAQELESNGLDEYDLTFEETDDDKQTSFYIDDGKYSDEAAERAVKNVVELDDRVKEALKKGAELLVQEQTDTLTQAKETLEAAIHANPHAGADMDALADEVVKSYTALLKVHPLRIPNEVQRFIIDTASELCSKYKNGFLGKVMQKMGFHEESGHDNDKTFRRIIESLVSDRNRSGIMWQLEGGGTDGTEYKNLLAGYAAIKQGFGARNSAAVRKCLEWAGIYDPAFSDVKKAGSQNKQDDKGQITELAPSTSESVSQQKQPQTAESDEQSLIDVGASQPENDNNVKQPEQQKQESVDETPQTDASRDELNKLNEEIEKVSDSWRRARTDASKKKHFDKLKELRAKRKTLAEQLGEKEPEDSNIAWFTKKLDGARDKWGKEKQPKKKDAIRSEQIEPLSKQLSDYLAAMRSETEPTVQADRESTEQVEEPLKEAQNTDKSQLADLLKDAPVKTKPEPEANSAPSKENEQLVEEKSEPAEKSDPGGAQSPHKTDEDLAMSIARDTVQIPEPDKAENTASPPKIEDENKNIFDSDEAYEEWVYGNSRELSERRLVGLRNDKEQIEEDIQRDETIIQKGNEKQVKAAKKRLRDLQVRRRKTDELIVEQEKKLQSMDGDTFPTSGQPKDRKVSLKGESLDRYDSIADKYLFGEVKEQKPDAEFEGKEGENEEETSQGMSSNAKDSRILDFMNYVVPTLKRGDEPTYSQVATTAKALSAVKEMLEDSTAYGEQTIDNNLYPAPGAIDSKGTTPDVDPQWYEEGRDSDLYRATSALRVLGEAFGVQSPDNLTDSNEVADYYERVNKAINEKYGDLSEVWSPEKDFEDLMDFADEDEYQVADKPYATSVIDGDEENFLDSPLSQAAEMYDDDPLAILTPSEYGSVRTVRQMFKNNPDDWGKTGGKFPPKKDGTPHNSLRNAQNAQKHLEAEVAREKDTDNGTRILRLAVLNCLKPSFYVSRSGGATKSVDQMKTEFDVIARNITAEKVAEQARKLGASISRYSENALNIELSNAENKEKGVRISAVKGDEEDRPDNEHSLASMPRSVHQYYQDLMTEYANTATEDGKSVLDAIEEEYNIKRNPVDVKNLSPHMKQKITLTRILSLPKEARDRFLGVMEDGEYDDDNGFLSYLLDKGEDLDDLTELYFSSDNESEESFRNPFTDKSLVEELIPGSYEDREGNWFAGADKDEEAGGEFNEKGIDREVTYDYESSKDYDDLVSRIHKAVMQSSDDYDSAPEQAPGTSLSADQRRKIEEKVRKQKAAFIKIENAFPELLTVAAIYNILQRTPQSIDVDGRSLGDYIQYPAFTETGAGNRQVVRKGDTSNSVLAVNPEAIFTKPWLFVYPENREAAEEKAKDVIKQRKEDKLSYSKNDSDALFEICRAERVEQNNPAVYSTLFI